MQTVVTTAALLLLISIGASARSLSQIDTLNSQTRTNVPGNVTTTYTPEQDSMYKAALSVIVSGRSRFEFDTRLLSDAMRASAELSPKSSNWENMQRNMTIPAEMLRPSAQEVVQHRVNIANAQYVPGVLIWPMGTGNIQVNLSDIAALFGMIEDVSPRISYSVDETSSIVIVVYSASAILVRTLFNGLQSPGSYKLDWDGRNDAGKMVANGDYVAEVRIGDQRIMRKHIVWPPQ